ncbi:MAG: D-alanyl-D-alanine carboxypeptidase/D-alanyl-D-alanine-endopeptidase [Bacteroidaceae bacterium]|nr:D-alanyl-D-alanine carboxypeptidase/D-alanyl-D-alanine-endopeptidase [Bacteroidaceae bacterium]
MRRVLATCLAAAWLAMPAAALDNKTIAHQIDSIVKNTLPAGTEAAIAVWDMAADTAVYLLSQDVLCRPASTMKVLTSYCALSTLGANYSFDTKVCATGQIGADGTLDGDLYIIGGFDPELMESDLKRLVQELYDKGLRRISGKVIADVSAMDSVYWGSGWVWDDTPSSFQPYVSPLMCHGGFVGVSLKPGVKGGAANVTVIPESKYYSIDNRSRTSDSKAGPVKVTRDWLHNENTIIVKGNVTKAQSTELNLFDSDKFTFCLFTEYLQKQGIGFNGTDWGTCPGNAAELTKASHSLKYVMKEALKESKNLNAECMFLQAARSRYPKDISFEKAAKYMTDFYKRALKNQTRPFNVADGSGLSVYDYIPAQMFIDVLRLIYSQQETFDIIYDCMPINGYDGTLRGRMIAKPLAGKVHAKTGSVTGACTLSGYATGADGRLLGFAILNQGAVTMSASRKVQDAICTVLCQ